MTAKASTFDDPNRESLGLAPIWTGAGETPDPEPEEPPAPEEQDPPAGRRRSSNS